MGDNLRINILLLLLPFINNSYYLLMKYLDDLFILKIMKQM